jgi:hypothetical protein
VVPAKAVVPPVVVVPKAVVVMPRPVVMVPKALVVVMPRPVVVVPKAVVMVMERPVVMVMERPQRGHGQHVGCTAVAGQLDHGGLGRRCGGGLRRRGGTEQHRTGEGAGANRANRHAACRTNWSRHDILLEHICFLEFIAAATLTISIAI